MSAHHVLHPAHELRDVVRAVLERSPHVRSRGFDVDVERDEVRITGEVHTWFEKQMAQESARRVAGVARVRNELVVVRDRVDDPSPC